MANLIKAAFKPRGTLHWCLFTWKSIENHFAVTQIIMMWLLQNFAYVTCFIHGSLIIRICIVPKYCLSQISIICQKYFVQQALSKLMLLAVKESLCYELANDHTNYESGIWNVCCRAVKMSTGGHTDGEVMVILFGTRKVGWCQVLKMCMHVCCKQLRTRDYDAWSPKENISWYDLFWYLVFSVLLLKCAKQYSC